MTFDVNDALVEGWERTTTVTAAQLFAAFVAVGLATAVAWNSLTQIVIYRSTILEDVFAGSQPGTVPEIRRQFQDQAGGLVLDLPLELLAVAVVILPLVGMVVKIGAIRWFVEEDGGELSPRLFTRRLVWTAFNLIVGGILYGVTVFIGLIFLVAPGVFLAVALFFYNYEIIVEGENALEGLANSWELTSGHRLRLFLLGALFAVAGFVIGWLANPIALPDPTLRTVVSTVLNSALGILGIGVAAAAYRQLRTGPEGEAGRAEETEVGALGPDDL